MGLEAYMSGVPAPEDRVSDKKKVKKKAAKKAVGKTVKVKTCQDCANYKHSRNVDFNKYFVNTLADHTVAFILSPQDFENLNNLHWHTVISSQLVNYNVLFLPFPRCYESAWTEKSGITTIKICREQWLAQKVKEYAVELVVLFPQTKKLLQVNKVDGYETAIRFEGNWSKFKGITAYLAKSLYSLERKGFDNEGFQHTVARVHRYFSNSLVWQKKKNFEPVSTLEQLEVVKSELASVDFLSLDVETSGLDVLAPDFRLKTIGLYWNGHGVSIGFEVDACMDTQYQDYVKTFILWLLKSNEIIKVMHNVKYEMKVFMAKWGRDLEFNNYEDTQFRAYLIDENRKSNALKYLAGEYYDGYETSPEDFESATFEDLWYYNCLDCYYTYNLCMRELDFNDKVDDSLVLGVESVYSLMLKQVHELALLEFDGVLVDFDYMEKLKVTLLAEIGKLEEGIKKNYPATVDKNLDSSKQLADILFSILKYPIIVKTKGGSPSTGKETLVTLSEKHDCELAAWLLTRKQKVKLLNTYVDAYIEKRDTLYDDRLRSSYLQTKNFDAMHGEGSGTTTGRLSSAGPNLQNIPRNKDVKRIFIPG